MSPQSLPLACGLLVVKRNEPLVPTRECIIAPRQVLDGLLSALHVYLSHQLMVTQRYLFALDIDNSVDGVTTSYHHCALLRTTSTSVGKQSNNLTPETVGINPPS